MTQPSESFPESAYNYGSLAELAAKDESDWEDSFAPQFLTPFQNIETGWSGVLQIKQFFVDALEGLGLSMEELNVLFVDVMSAVKALMSGDASAFLAALEAVVVDLINLILPGSPLNSLNLFNLVPTNLLGQLNFSNIGETLTNLIQDPLFAIEEAFSGLAEWFRFPGLGHNGEGAALTTADGTLKEMLSNLIPVSAGQVLDISGWARWTGLAGTGSPVQLGVTGYTAEGAATTQSTIAAHNTTPPTTDWTQLQGTYTVPNGVSAIRTRLTVAPTATAGDVYFDDMSATKTQTIFQKLMAGTNPGENMTNDVEHLFTGIISNTIALLDKAGLGDFNELVSGIGGDIGDDIDSALDRINTFLHGGSPLNASNINTGNVPDQHVPGLGTIHDAIVTAVGNLSGNGFNIGKMLEVLTGQTHSVVDTSSNLVSVHSRLAQAESKLNALPVNLGGNGIGISYGGIQGTTDTDEFERVSTTTLGPNWLTYYSGGGAGFWATPNGHDAEYVWSGTGDREFLSIRNIAAIPRSLTDYQRVTSVLSAKATREQNLFGDWFGSNDCWLRVSDDTTSLANVTGIRIRWSADGGLYIHRFLGGAGVLLKSASIDPPGPGAALIGEAGSLQGGTLRYFRGVIGASTRIEIVETGTASGAGAAYRRWGHGGKVMGWSGLFDNGQERPATIHHINLMDQVFT